MDKRILRSYFGDGKVNVKMFANWFRNLGLDNNVSDDDMVKLALVLFLEMTLVGKDDRNAIMYWALQLVDDLDAFNSFPWGTFLYGRTFDSLSTCVVGRDDKYKERLESPAKRKAEKYNVYGFVTAFQVWAIEAIPKWGMLGYASRTCHNVDTDVINLSQDNNIHFEPSTFHSVFPSPEMAKGNFEPSDDVKQLSRPPKITIKVTRDRKRSAYTVSPYIDPTAKRPRKPKMPEFRRDSPLDEDVLRSMNSWINDNNLNTSMHTSVFEANPHWFQILLSEIGWLDGDTRIQGRWSLLVENKTQFKHETYKWDSEMTDYVIGKKPVEAWEHWRKVNLILFPTNVNGNHWIAIAVNLK
ncbi:hypothetical protein Ddye_016420 [Dipteronia dyeriana]|uniref:Ubiquitin-like protease family profile domain-containing protein n=1 Tax=Dipteronia dyeriana TaxID=168575 RepID=A0AAD9WZK1_9ROSI|nr:hypothetical protein Ddye_016420 [Dipteronia dyeriana]